MGQGEDKEPMSESLRWSGIALYVDNSIEGRKGHIKTVPEVWEDKQVLHEF